MDVLLIVGPFAMVIIAFLSFWVNDRMGSRTRSEAKSETELAPEVVDAQLDDLEPLQAIAAEEDRPAFGELPQPEAHDGTIKKVLDVPVAKVLDEKGRWDNYFGKPPAVPIHGSVLPTASPAREIPVSADILCKILQRDPELMELEALNEIQRRQMFLLYKGRGYQAIATDLDVPEGMIVSSVRRAAQIILHEMQKKRAVSEPKKAAFGSG